MLHSAAVKLASSVQDFVQEKVLWDDLAAPGGEEAESNEAV